MQAQDSAAGVTQLDTLAVLQAGDLEFDLEVTALLWLLLRLELALQLGVLFLECSEQLLEFILALLMPMKVVAEVFANGRQIHFVSRRACRTSPVST